MSLQVARRSSAPQPAPKPAWAQGPVPRGLEHGCRTGLSPPRQSPLESVQSPASSRVGSASAMFQVLCVPLP